MYYPDFMDYQYPAYIQKPQPPAQRIKHNSNYWCPLGWLRVFIMACTLGGAIAGWCVVYSELVFAAYGSGPASTRAACIVCFSIWFSLSLLIFAMSVSNFVNLPGIDSYYYLIAFAVIDGCGFFALLGCGIAAAVNESVLAPLVIINFGYRPGSFTACAVFGIFGGILELVSALYEAYVVYELEYKDDY